MLRLYRLLKMPPSAVIVILLLLAAASEVDLVREYYSSITGLEQLLTTEQHLLQELDVYLAAAKLQINTLESELQRLRNEHRLVSEDGIEDYLTNPVNAYRLVKRLYSDWRSFEQRVEQDDAVANFLKSMKEHRALLSFPSEDDVDGSALALARLQETYRLDVAHVAAGILNGIKYGPAMTWQDCFVLGQQLYAMAEYNHTKLWLKESMRRLGEENYVSEPTSLHFMEVVAENLYDLGDVATALDLSNRVLHLDPARAKATAIKRTTERSLRQDLPQPDTAAETDNYHSTEEYRDYKRLCRGEQSAPTAAQRPLRCRYMTNNVAYRLLAPFKLEEHNLQPLVFSLHDVIADEGIAAIREMAVPHMERSLVRAKMANESQMSHYRVSTNAWLPYDSDAHMRRMLHDLQDATGLDMSNSEQLQVANYGPGGHYEPHWDFYLNDEQIPDNDGNRIATAIFYLSDVELGGATAFPFLGVSVRPKRGNVLFWYNLHRSLDKDYRTKHAGCPVLKGSKWIANVWIREKSQIFTKPCALQPDHETSLKYQIVY